MNCILYMHSGSANHGCEAIVRATVRILRGYDLHLFSDSPDADLEYDLDQILSVSEAGSPISKADIFP